MLAWFSKPLFRAYQYDFIMNLLNVFTKKLINSRKMGRIRASIRASQRLQYLINVSVIGAKNSTKQKIMGSNVFGQLIDTSCQIWEKYKPGFYLDTAIGFASCLRSRSSSSKLQRPSQKPAAKERFKTLK
ncbi:hypothetical protein ACQ86O_08905 [Serratia sp. L9]|uniref:hypothetical protein n=1 Tax=Serratia sp. L9 TaxID=3423946 RepID=UPI003D672E6A